MATTTAPPARQVRWPTDRGLLTPDRYFRIYGANRQERFEFMSEDELYMQRIVQIRPGIYVTPSQTFFRTGKFHFTNYNNKTCSCDDFRIRHIECKHLILVDAIENTEIKERYPITEFRGVINF